MFQFIQLTFILFQVNYNNLYQCWWLTNKNATKLLKTFKLKQKQMQNMNIFYVIYIYKTFYIEAIKSPSGNK